MKIRLSGDESKMVIAEENGKVVLLDHLNTPSVSQQELVNTKELLKSLEFSKDGDYLACGTSDGNIFLFEESNHYLNPKKIKAHQSPIYAITFKDDGRLLATGAGNGEIKLWQVNNFLLEPLLLKGNDSWVWDIAFIQQGDVLAVAGGDRTIRTWSFNQDQLMKQNCEATNRDFTLAEWQVYIGDDIAKKDVCNNLLKK